VVDFNGVRKSYGNKMLFDQLSFSLPKGGVIGVVGPNGAGKTSLFRLIAGLEKPDAGTVRVGDTVKLAYVDQNRESLKGEKTVWEEISHGQDVIKLGLKEVNSRAYVSWFNFSGTDQQKKVGTLSGGERNRVNLAKTLQTGANVLLLDEPTNDLDVNTMRALEDAILEFGGSVVVISHDRWFLDRVCTHLLVFEGDSKVQFFHGNFSEYEEDLKKRLGEQAQEPKKFKFRPIQ
jgi:energy-dependent translational throttle protein EttA